jgi:hypothetical protein
MTETERTARALLGYVVAEVDRGLIGTEPNGKGLWASNPGVLARAAGVASERVYHALELIQARKQASFEWHRPGFWIKPTIEGRLVGEEHNESRANVQEVSVAGSTAEWDAFVCHASEDKADVADPLCRALIDRHGLRVWYDRFELTIGLHPGSPWVSIHTN